MGVGVRQTGGLKGTNELSKKYPLFIVSNGQIEYLQAIVETYNLDRFIQNTYSNQLIGSGHKSDLVQMVKNKNQKRKSKKNPLIYRVVQTVDTSMFIEGG
ncbi:hypothetical protein [Peribacillus frigoritolerans]|uniref:hypothetical protein n=1 Tax=Peribacillus frigoritolerans TaxID=450367 RepID=UPI00223026B5|nr:hypothetical protein [Peribacillus frigoritolerans]MDM5309521.1 hypothetical protein [Peribacillus frigoritolerans]UZD48872.1 hypothetical protein OMJ04_10605 [Peribacillus frigoritolerans]